MARWIRPARAVAALALAVGACSNSPSRLDQIHTKHAGGGDSWLTGGGDGDDSGGGKDKGFDFAGMLSKIKDAVEKPGPYEAPEHSADYDAAKRHWGVLALSGDVVETESFSFTGGKGVELRKLADRLRELAADDQLIGVVVRVGDVKISMPDLVELRAAMHEFRAAHKQLRCHAEHAGNATYLLLAACDAIGLAPLGEVAITGPAVMPVHVKGLLDKLGVQADFIHVGAWKGAAEPLTLDAPSKEMQETLGAILDQRYATMVDIIAKDRALDPAAVKALIDTGIVPADQAVAAKLVDEVAPFEVFRAAGGQPWTRLELDRENHLGAYLKLARFIGAMPPDRPSGDHVAVVYAVGNIVDGGNGGVLGARTEIASRTLVAALDAIAAEPSVKAVVLRIDSGGGSAQASELIWQAVDALRAKKPVIVSMSDVAASGGYYIASGATKIFALDDTLTGSIGVIGGHIAPGAAFAKLGVAAFPIGRGKHATMMTGWTPWTADERQLIETTMKSVYGTFVARVAAGRHQTPEAIDKIAQGRVWTGAKAKDLGLVDAIGGLDAALAAARDAGHVDAKTDLEIYPPAPTLRDIIHEFSGGGGIGATLGLGGLTGLTGTAQLRDLLAALDPSVADVAEQLVALVMSFRTTHVQTLAVLPGWTG